MLAFLIAQTTQQTTGGFASWGPAEWVLVIGALFTGLTGLIIAIRSNQKSGAAQDDTKQLAENTALLNRVVDKNDPLVTVPPDVSAKTVMIHAGTGTGT